MLSADAIDALTETVVTRLLVEQAAARVVAVDLAHHMVAGSPAIPALVLALPFTLAASAIEDMLGAGASALSAAQDAWRVAALIGSDALALRLTGEGGDTMADLVALWGDGDEVFGPPA